MHGGDVPGWASLGSGRAIRVIYHGRRKSADDAARIAHRLHVLEIFVRNAPESCRRYKRNSAHHTLRKIREIRR